MDRRTFLKSAVCCRCTGDLLAASPLQRSRNAPRQRRCASCRLLISPISIRSGPATTSSAMPDYWCGDMLYGIDNTLTPRRQMVEAEEISGGWPHLDVPPAAGTEIPRRRAGSCERRGGKHQPLGSARAHGGMIKAIENELTAVDDRTFRWSLKRPYPKMPLALGKSAPPCCFVMPARIAATDPFRQIGEYVGSGPMRFVRNEWVPGAKRCFEKFAGYVPRQEPPSWFAGSKNIVVDRIEWITNPRPSYGLRRRCRTARLIGWNWCCPNLLPVLRRIAIW